MDELTRRSLLRYACGATAAGVVAGPCGTGAQGLAGGLSGGSLPGPGAAADSYRVVPEEAGSRRYGMVDDLFRHIKDRTDVKREILYWLTDGRSSFLGATNRFQFLEPIIRPLYRQAGIPLEFGYGLGLQESLYRNYSVSYANAKGIWQMQWAGRRYGLKGGDYFDVVKSTQKQLEYLRDLVKAFSWNLELVLVDYNYGPGHKFARYSSNPNAFRRIASRLPRETRRYVPRVLAATAMGMAPERFGLDIPRLDPRTVTIPLDRSLHHLELGLLLDTDHWNLGNLNPRNSIQVWFKEGEEVTIPRIFQETCRERLEKHPLREEFHGFVANAYPAPGQSIEYRVQRGDTLFRISRRFKDCGVEGPNQIMLYNGLNSTVIRPGQKLLIPCAD